MNSQPGIVVVSASSWSDMEETDAGRDCCCCCCSILLIADVMGMTSSFISGMNLSAGKIISFSSSSPFSCVSVVVVVVVVVIVC